MIETNKIYRSKISYGLLTFVTFTCLIAWILPALYEAPSTTMIVLSLIMIGTLAFIFHAFYTTCYWINEAQELRVKAGFTNNMTIPVSKIIKIKKTSSWLASPAASFDRIEIFYGQWNSVVISPKDKTGLIRALQTINPNIEVNI